MVHVTNLTPGSADPSKRQANTFVEQMRFGVREAANNPASLLVFSGGKTRRDAGSISEGLSYWEVSRAFGWFGEEGTHERAFTEVGLALHSRVSDWLHGRTYCAGVRFVTWNILGVIN